MHTQVCVKVLCLVRISCDVFHTCLIFHMYSMYGIHYAVCASHVSFTLGFYISVKRVLDSSICIYIYVYSLFVTYFVLV